MKIQLKSRFKLKQISETEIEIQSDVINGEFPVDILNNKAIEDLGLSQEEFRRASIAAIKEVIFIK